MKKYQIIDEEIEMNIITESVDDVIKYLYNYVDYDFRNWSSLQDDRLSYLDGRDRVKSNLINHNGGTHFDWSERSRKYGNCIKQINVLID